MAASNRYSQITPSQFNPLSLEEVMMVPLMKRQQHDAFNKQLSDAQLKVDPLKVHEDEALQLQRDFEAKKLKYAEQLMREGVNPNSSSEFLKFNREYQDLISPMGRVGKINQAKTLRDAERVRFLENASKQYGSARALELWDEHEKDYLGYEDPEKSKIKFIDSKGIVAAQNFDEDLKNYHSLLGEIQSSTAGSGYRIVDSGLGDGSKIMVNSSGQTIHSDNIDALNEQRKLLDSKWLQETGEGYKFNVEAGINLDNFRNRFDSAINMQKKKSDISKSDASANFINGGGTKPDSGYPTGVFDPASQYTTAEDVQKIDFSKIGTQSASGFGGGFGTNVDMKNLNNKTNLVTYENSIKDPAIRRAYKLEYDRMVASGEVTKDQNINSNSVALKIQNKFRNGEIVIPTIGNDVIQADVTPSSQLFMGELQGKDANKRNETIQKNLESGFRTIIDPESGKELTPEEFRDKGYKVEYVGYDSPVNYRKYDFMGDNDETQSVMAHKVNVYDDEGKSLGLATVSRTSQELKSIPFRKALIINKTYRKAVDNFDEWVEPENVKNTKVIFKRNGTFDIEYNGQKVENLNNAQYQMVMDDIISNQKN